MAPVRVTIAYDGSEGAMRAVAAAATLFAGAEARLVLVPDPPPQLQSALPSLSWDTLNRVVEEFEADRLHSLQELVDEGVAAAEGLSATGVVVEPHAPAWQALLKAAEGSDVLVCGTRGRGGLARALLGSTSMSLLHHAELPLLITPAAAGDGPLVIAYDGSEHAAHAIATAGRLFPGREAVVVHVWESPYRHTRSGRALAGLNVDEVREVVKGLDETLATAAAEMTERGVELARFAGLQPSGETVDSGEGVWRAIVATASAQQASAIVSGARGLGSARSALLGSVSSGLVQNAERPVLVVPA